MLPSFKIEVPPFVRAKVTEIWYSLGQSLVQKALVGNKCPICLEFRWIGERHHNCVSPISPENTCIICLRDERSGNHAVCKVEIRRLRAEIINLFRKAQ